MASMVQQLLQDIEQDDRLVTIAVLQSIYPELSIAEAFSLLEDPMSILTVIIELSNIPDGTVVNLDLSMI